MGWAQFKGQQYGNSYTATIAHRVANNHNTEEPEFRNAPNSTAYTGFTPGSNTVYNGKQQRTTRGWNRRFDLRVVTNVASVELSG